MENRFDGYMPIYKCERCGTHFSPPKENLGYKLDVLDAFSAFAGKSAHECRPGMLGLGKLVGFDVQ